MIEIDGKHGEGGGQILRTSVSLSAITGKPIRIFDIRARRRKPGIQRQHLQSILAAAEACSAECEGARLDSTELIFHPGDIQAGDFKFVIPSAGSTTLVLQTVLPVLFQASSPSTVTILGGTHNPMAPPFEAIRDSFLPAISQMGFKANIELVRHGFYPKGGGEIRARIEPFSKDEARRWGFIHTPSDLLINAKAILSNLPLHIAEREREVFLNTVNVDQSTVEFEMVPAPNNPGNAFIVTVKLPEYSLVFSSIGEKGKPAEKVALEAVHAFKDWIESGTMVDYHLADQLLLYMALVGGGKFTTNFITEHFRTNVDIIKMFMDINVSIEESAVNNYRVEMS